MEEKYVSKNDLQAKIYYEIGMKQKYAPHIFKIDHHIHKWIWCEKGLDQKQRITKIKKDKFHS